MPLGDEIRDAMRDDARLARARAGEDQQRAVGVANGVLLFGLREERRSMQWLGTSCQSQWTCDYRLPATASILP